MKKLKMGIVGLGRLGRQHAENICFRIPNAELVAVCSIKQEEVDEVMNNWGVPAGYTDFDKILENKDMEAVFIASASAAHGEQIIKALRAGFHVFTEKPLGVNVEECLTVEEEVKKYPDKIFTIGFMRRFDPSYAYAKKLIDEGEIGQPIMVRSVTIDTDDTAEFALQFTATSGGLFLDFNTHDVDLARWILGSEVDEVYSIGGCYVHKGFEKYQDADNAISTLKFKNGTMATIYAGRTAMHGHHIETEIIGTKGTLRIGNEPEKNQVDIFNSNGLVKHTVKDFLERFEEAYLLEVQNFVDCVLEGRKPELNAIDGTKSTEVAFAMTKSYREKHVVKL